MSHRSLVVILALALVTPGAAAYARGMSGPGESPAAFLKIVDTNGDKTVSKEELDTYAKKRFAELENDNDKVLDQKELKGRLSAAGMRTADTDKDKTVDESEFVGYADQLFDMANKKGDKTLSLAELKTPAGRKLIRLLH